MNQEERIILLEQEVMLLKKEIQEIKETKEGDKAPQAMDIEHLKRRYQTENASVNSQANTPEVYRLPPREMDQEEASGLHSNNSPLDSKKEENKIYKQTIDMEQKIGKNIIGILASILIFIGLTLFGALIYKSLSDCGKSMILFAVSGVILISGILLHKRLKNIFTLSLIGCGMGAGYVSLIVSSVFLQIFSDITLYILILIWLAGMAYLCQRYESKALFLIGQCGIIVATCFGIGVVETNGMKWFLVVLFFIITTAFYLYKSKMQNSRIVENIMYFSTIGCTGALGISNLYLCFSYIEMLESTTIYAMISMLLIIYIILLFSLYLKRIEHKGSLEKVLAIFYGLEVTAVLPFCVKVMITLFYGLEDTNYFYYEGTIGYSVFLILLGYLIIGMVERLVEKEEKEIQRVVVVAQVIVMTYCVLQLLQGGKYFGLMIFIVPAMVYGYYKNQSLYKILGLLLLGIQGLCWSEFYILHMIIMLLCFFVYGYLIYKDKEKQSVYKLILYTMGLLYSFSFAKQMQIMINSMKLVQFSRVYTWCLFTGICNFIILKSNYVYQCRNKNEKEKKLYTMARIVNIIVLFTSMVILGTNISAAAYTILFLLTCALCLLGTKEMLTTWREKRFVGFYIGIKITLFIRWTLMTMNITYGIIISMILLIISILSILYGLKIGLQSLRVYGLGLTMLSVVKLIMLDMKHTNTIESVLGFFACGVLCFGINLIYNLLSKKWEEEQNQ